MNVGMNDERTYIWKYSFVYACVGECASRYLYALVCVYAAGVCVRHHILIFAYIRTRFFVIVVVVALR